MKAADENPLVEAYDFFVINASSERITLKGYLNKRDTVLRGLRKAVLENPGYLGIFLGILLGWVNTAGYLADLFVAFFIPAEIEFRSDSYAHIFRTLTGLVAFLAIWLVSRHCVVAYRTSGERAGEDSQISGNPEAEQFSRIWIGISIFLYAVSSVVAGCSLYTLSLNFADTLVSNQALLTLIIVAGMWANSLRVCWMGIGVNGAKVPTALLVTSLIPGIEVGTLYSQFAGVGTPSGSVLEMLAVVFSTLSLTWLGFVGINLLGDGRVTRRVSKSADSRIPQKRAVSEWIRRDVPLWLISLTLCTVAVALLDVIGIMLLAMFGAVF
mgnify:CR=1 FL=1